MIAQLSIFLDASGQVRCEAPGPNGARIRIDLDADFARRNPEIMSALAEQQDAWRRKEAARLEAVRKANIDYVAAEHESALARRVWGEAAFAQAVARHARREGLPSAKVAKPVLSANSLNI